jgi:hypothetical protein
MKILTFWESGPKTCNTFYSISIYIVRGISPQTNGSTSASPGANLKLLLLYEDEEESNDPGERTRFP